MAAGALRPKVERQAEPAPLSDQQMTLIAKALADPRRYEILRQLAGCAEDSVTCGAILSLHAITPATLSHHTKELVMAGLVEAVKRGKYVNFRLRRDVLGAYLVQVGRQLL